jgi:hypothetical protein
LWLSIHHFLNKKLILFLNTLNIHKAQKRLPK